MESTSDDFERAFRDLWPAAFRVAYRLLGDAAEAEDAAAEAFARALVAWRRVRELPHREAWVLRVVSNVAVDRGRSRRRVIDTDPEARRTAPAVINDEELTVLRLALLEALRALPRRQREVIVLRHLGGLRERDVAAALGISVNSVKKHTTRGLARLRSRLDERATEVEVAI